EVEEVVGIGVERLVQPARSQLEADLPPRAATGEHEQVAPIRIDVHQVRVERADAQPTLAPGGDARALTHAASPRRSPRARRWGGRGGGARRATPPRSPRARGRAPARGRA